ncbi:peroxiredoxin-like family protein [Hufsiella ginkgonis]|uniref:thioredoxin-dependent peroxiredoxin n=1 Tax=Hufsiella ginkgonis TaxID=2695274 RepID=A0A7K1XS27_9SPHI|nr:peroxiredoxin-like family protein [Hufsiella ginkgonis]MXV13793.1 redoxin domain-containing protein [Hufsiella ginkgonis]
MTQEKIPVYNEEYATLRDEMSNGFPADSLEVWDADSERMDRELKDPLRLKAGDSAPMFELPNAVGKRIALEDFLAEGPVIITFYRGVWCPYCNLALSTYQRILKQIKSYGANLFAISPQLPDHSLSTKEKNKLEFEVLSDSHNSVAKQYVQTFINSEASTSEALKLGVDFSSFNDGDIVELPVPAVYIVSQDGKIAFAKSAGADYRHRVEPAEILEALKALTTNK